MNEGWFRPVMRSVSAMPAMPAMMRILIGLIVAHASAATAQEELFAQDVQQEPELTLTRVNERVFSAIGVTEAPSYENWGHNNNLSFIIGSRGVMVINGGDNYLLARALHREIRKLTDLPVRWVVNENGQGHAFLGNSYWVDLGVALIAHRDAVHEIEERGESVLRTMQQRNRERAFRTRVVTPTSTFDSTMSIDLGDQSAQLIWFGPAHSPGDISVWLADDSVLIAGDIAFHERLLGVFPDTDVMGWIETFGRMQKLAPDILVPGHGHPTTLAQVERSTLGYLQYLVTEVRSLLEGDGDLAEAYEIDQSAYQHLDTFDELAAKNAGRVFQQLEMEFF